MAAVLPGLSTRRGASAGVGYRTTEGVWQAMRVVALAGLALAGLLAAADARGEEFRASDVMPGDHPTTRALDYISQLVRERSDGQHGFRVSHGAEIGTERFVLEKVRSGSLDLARADMATFNSIASSTVLLSQDLLYRTGQDYRNAFDGPIAAMVLQDLERAGFIGLCFYRTGARSFYGARAIRKVADLRGARVRVSQTDAWSHALESLGAKPVIVPAERVRASLAAGAVDVAEGTWPYFADARHFDVAKTFSPTFHAEGAGIVVFSRVIWERLSSDDQAIIRQAALDSVAWFESQWEESDADARRLAATVGVAVVDKVEVQALRSALRASYVANVRDPRLRRIAEQGAPQATPATGGATR